ncbi:6177_t:CDS:2, partial [Racocetra persica]
MSVSHRDTRSFILFDSSKEQDINDDRSVSSELDNLSDQEGEDRQTFIQNNERQSDGFDFDDHLIPLALTETRRHPTLEKEVTFYNGLNLVIGSIIGSGIFASPGPVVMHAGSVGMSLIVWLTCGLLACTGALTYAELGSEIPISGGEHAYLSHAYGSLPAFLFSWTAITCLKPGGNAIIAVIFAEYLNRIIYHTAFESEENHPSPLTHKILNKIVAIICVILITLVVIAIIGFVVIGRGGMTKNFDGDLFAESSTRASDYALAFYS